METRAKRIDNKVMVSPEWWDSVQTDLQDAVNICNTMTSAIAAHHINGKYEPQELIEIIEGQVRVVRKLIENMITPI